MSAQISRKFTKDECRFQTLDHGSEGFLINLKPCNVVHKYDSPHRAVPVITSFYYFHHTKHMHDKHYRFESSTSRLILVGYTALLIVLFLPNNSSPIKMPQSRSKLITNYDRDSINGIHNLLSFLNTNNFNSMV